MLTKKEIKKTEEINKEYRRNEIEKKGKGGK